ncbi:MAG TPA: serine/threonine-protein kinase [Gemmataceae bacterium]|nr:serine/threonine-protein kinase [Gemmataceae bacterium]
MREREIFDAALAIADPAERSAYLAEVCSDNLELREHIQGLLAMHQQLGSFLEPPACSPVGTAEKSLSEYAGTMIGPYKLLEQIGEGGMGIVYMAEQEHPVRRKVALKIIKPGMDSKQVIARFEAERQALALMDHPHIAHVLDAGTADSGHPYFAMELIRGIPITQFCDENRLTSRERLELFVTVCQAVQHAHQKGIIHRDIKPSNVLVTLHDGRPVAKVIDFGIAKALGHDRLTDKTLFTGFTHMMGTPLYMSPEQAQMSGQDVDTRTDVYALGVLLYELLTGTTPFDKERLRDSGYDEIRRIICNEEPAKPSTRISTLGEAATIVSANRRSEPRRLYRLFRRELDWIVMKALEKDRNRRYDTASAFTADVQCYLDDGPVQACPPTLVQRLAKWCRRHPAAVWAALLLLAGILSTSSIATVLIVWERDRTKENYERAQGNLDTAYRILDEIYLANAENRLPQQQQLTADDRRFLDKALAFYAEFAKQNSSDPQVRLKMAQACRRIGEVREWLGQDREAMAAYQQALTVSAQLAAEFPQNRHYRHSLAQSYLLVDGMEGNMWIGQELSGRRTEIENAFTNALRILDQLVQEVPTDLEYWHDLGSANARFGYIHLYHSGLPPAEAEAWIRRGLEIREKLVAEKPNELLYQVELGESLGNLGNLLEMTDHMQEAEAILHRELQVRRQTFEVFPEKMAACLRLGDAYMDRAGFFQLIGKVQEEVEALRQELALRQKVAAAFPSVWITRSRVIITHWKLGDALHRLGAQQESLAAYREAIAGCQEAVQTGADNPASYFLLWGRALAGLGAPHEAVAAWEQAVQRGAENAEVANRVAWFLASESEPPIHDTELAVLLARKAVAMAPLKGGFWNTLGLAYYRAEKWQDTVAALTKSTQLRDGGDSGDWFFLAMAYCRLGNSEEARHWFDQAAEWMDKNKPRDQELHRYRTEAAALLGIEEVPLQK